MGTDVSLLTEIIRSRQIEGAARRNRRVDEAGDMEMPGAKDPTKAIRKAAAALPNVVEGTSCNQTSYKAGKKAFLYVGPGTKGIGYKAMFKLEVSLDAQDSRSY